MAKQSLNYYDIYHEILGFIIILINKIANEKFT